MDYGYKDYDLEPAATHLDANADVGSLDVVVEGAIYHLEGYS